MVLQNRSREFIYVMLCKLAVGNTYIEVSNIEVGNTKVMNIAVGKMPFGKMPFGNMQFGNMPIGNMPFGKIPLGNMPFGNMPFGNMPFGNMPFGNMPFGNMPFGNMPFGNMPFNNMPFGNMPFGNMPFGNMPFGNMELDYRPSRPFRLISQNGGLRFSLSSRRREESGATRLQPKNRFRRKKWRRFIPGNGGGRDAVADSRFLIRSLKRTFNATYPYFPIQRRQQTLR
jgi:hypothetical protein